MTEYVYPEHFGMATTEAARSEFKKYMEPVTHVYSKGMATGAQAAVSKVRLVQNFMTAVLPVLKSKDYHHATCSKA